MSIITTGETHDIRFPTSQELDGSDAMNPDPDYSAAYFIIKPTTLTGMPGTDSSSPSDAATRCRRLRSRRWQATSWDAT
jgi:hypothetical protein